MQNVFFISEIKPDFYPKIDKHYTWYPIHTKLSFEEFSKLWHKKKPYAIYTYGNALLNYLSKIFNVRKRWVHLHSLPEELDILACVFSSVLKHRYEDDNPLISVITSTFHSKEKILRPWNTLRNQTYTNWEWIVWDDSTDMITYENLLEMKNKDLRMRVYKAPEHSSIIGEMKRLAAGVAYGKFIVELDHDDEIHPELFQWIINAAKTYPEANFFYTDAAQLYEKSLKNHNYGDFFGYGYGANANVWSKMHNQWVTQIITAFPNPITLRHLIGMPNHVRVWRTEFYDKIGKHNPQLSVSDDYELLVKSYIYGKWCYIRKCGYYQYRNEDGNFTFIRNSLIQHNVKHIYEHYKSLLPPVPNDHKYQPLWKYEKEEERYHVTHLTYDPNSFDYSVIMLEPTIEKIETILKLKESLQICIVGECPEIPVELRHRVYWWKLGSDDINDKLRYAKKVLAIGKEVIMDNELDKII